MKESLLWARYTWALFHTIIEKLKDEDVNSEIINIQDMIYTIVGILPCPDCRQHGILYLQTSKKKGRYGAIKNKQELKEFIFEFHNVVNRRIKKPIKNIEILEQYKTISLAFIIQYWNKYFRLFNVDQYTIREESNRQRIKQSILSYLNKINNKLI